MTRRSIEKRLSSYWKLEAANVVLLPLFAVYMAWSSDWQLGRATIIAFVPVCLLLAIGAQYWRAKLQQLRSGASLPARIALLARLEPFALGTCVVAVASCGLAWATPGWSASNPDRWFASVMTLLALLEYVNYYHRQVQHFDHGPDFKRLISGKGFRPSQMAVDINRWRAGRR